MAGRSRVPGDSAVGDPDIGTTSGVDQGTHPPGQEELPEHDDAETGDAPEAWASGAFAASVVGQPG